MSRRIELIGATDMNGNGLISIDGGQYWLDFGYYEFQLACMSISGIVALADWLGGRVL